MIVVYAVVYLFAAGLSLVVAALCWRRRAIPGGAALAWLMGALAIWAFAETMEMLAVPVPVKIMWSKVSYLGAATAPLLVLLFALEYGGQPLSKRRAAALAALPIVVLLLVLTNEWHELFWNRIEPIPSSPNILEYGHGIGFWLTTVYAYLAVLAALFVLARASDRFAPAYRPQAFALLIAVLIPFASNALYVMGASPIQGLDLAPMAFIVGGLLLAVSILRLHLLDLVPVARDTLIQELNDGVIVLDERERIVDLNPAAIRLLGPHLVVGAPYAAVTGETLRNDCWLEVRASPLVDGRGTATGRLVTVRDVTERKQMQAQLEQLAVVNERQRLARDLHDSVTQSLNSLILSAYTATNRLQQGKYERLADSIAQMSEGARQALKEMRLLLYNLRLTETQGIALGDALRLRLESVEKRAGIDADITAENVPPLAPDVEHHVYLIATEALNNSLRHAGASTVRVRLTGQGNGLTLDVVDNGKGFDPQMVRAGGMGLTNLRTRAGQIGGRLEIESAPGQGTRIHLCVEEV